MRPPQPLPHQPKNHHPKKVRFHQYTVQSARNNGSVHDRTCSGALGTILKFIAHTGFVYKRSKLLFLIRSITLWGYRGFRQALTKRNSICSNNMTQTIAVIFTWMFLLPIVFRFPLSVFTRVATSVDLHVVETGLQTWLSVDIPLSLTDRGFFSICYFPFTTIGYAALTSATKFKYATSRWLWGSHVSLRFQTRRCVTSIILSFIESSHVDVVGGNTGRLSASSSSSSDSDSSSDSSSSDTSDSSDSESG